MKATKAPSKSAVTTKSKTETARPSPPKSAPKLEPKTTIVKATLPGQAEVNSKLLDEAVEDLNRLYRTKGLETARAVGEYVLETFFEGDVDNFRTAGTKHVSFRNLAKREDLQLSYLFIWNSVAVVDQLRLLPEKIAEALPLSHHKLLLPVKDEKKKVQLAEAAVNQKLSKRAFVKSVREVRDAQKSESNVGRPTTPGFAKAVTALKKVVKTASEDITDEKIIGFGVDKAKKALATLEGHIGALQEVAEELRRRVEE